MLNLQKLYDVLYENVRLLKNLRKSIHNQQNALVENDIYKIQETALQQADFMERIHSCQLQIKELLEPEFAARKLSWKDGLEALNDFLPMPWNKKIKHLMDLQDVYLAEIEEIKSNNKILMENALEFIQQQMRIIVDIAKENPFYNKEKESGRALNHLLNKKI